MEKISASIHQKIDNQIYDTPDKDLWWDDNEVLHMLKTSVNPARVGYFQRVIKELGIQPMGKKVLEVGCGGGIMSEEVARMGFATTGIDPSPNSLKIAKKHADSIGLSIDYQKGTGENIPFPDQYFEAVVCCDVLEHVQDLPKVISEIARVLKPGGLFFFDTLNRTFLSKLVAIKIWQEWKSTAFMPPNLHVWEMFIKPKELKALLDVNKFEAPEFIGAKPNVSVPKMISTLCKRAKGKIGYRELGQTFWLVETNDKSIFYMGYTIKK